MRHWVVAIAMILIAVQGVAQENGSKFTYADFEKLDGNKPVSTRGGTVLMSGNEEVNTVTYTNSTKQWPRLPFIVQATKNNTQAVGFDFSIPAPNAWASVTLEVHGMPDKDGKQVAEDLSAYNYVTVQIFAKGIESMRCELISRDNGLKLDASHGMSFRLAAGFTTYRLPVKEFVQPSWSNSPKISAKEVLKKLTSVNFSVTKIPSTGQVVLDNIGFEK
jgi:hypothetical protein